MTSAPSFRLLPVEATEAMVGAGADALRGWIAPLMHMDDAWKRMVSAAPVLAEATGWQPIETAPKDGTKLLLAGTMTSGAKYRLIGSWYITSWRWGWRYPEDHNEPTHWQYLPPDPPALNASLAIAAGQLGGKESGE